MRQRLRGARSPLVVLGAAVAAVTAYVLTFAFDTTAYLNDEYGSVIAGRGMARDPGEIVSATAAGLFRGPERLTSVLLAVPDAVLGTAPDEMKAGHLLLALAYAMVAVPAYALLRGLEVPRWPAVGLAVAAILGPWAVFGTTLLNLTLAAPLTVAFVWATWRAVVSPSLGAEVLAVAVAALMTTARASHAVFFAAAVLAAVLAAWWTRPAGAGVGSVPKLVVRRNPLIVGIALVGLVVLAVIGPSTLAGQAYDAAAEIKFPLDQIWDSLGWNTAVLAIATGFVAVPVGGAWALRQAVRPTDVRAGAFAVLALAIFVLYAWVAGASGSEEQERYPAFLAAFPLIALGAALYRRGEAWVLGTVVIALLTARVIATRGGEEVVEPLNYFFAPAQLFFSKVVVGRLTTLLPGDEHMVAIATLGAAALAIALAALASRRAVAAVAIAALVGLGLVAAVYTLRKYEPATAPGSLAEVAWLDRAGEGEDSVFWNYQWSANAPDRDVYTRRTIYHNTSACCGEWRPGPELFLRAGGRLEREPTPQFVAGFTGYRPVVFAAEEIARPSAYGTAMRVERFVGDEPRAAAVVVGAGVDGAVEDEPVEIVAYPALEGRCLDVRVTSRAEAPGTIGFVVGRERGRLGPGEQRVVRTRGSAVVRRTGSVDAPMVLDEIRYVGCDDPPSR